MAADIFPQPEVGTHFNKNFINFLNWTWRKVRDLPSQRNIVLEHIPLLHLYKMKAIWYLIRLEDQDAAGFIQMATAVINNGDRSPVYNKSGEEGDKKVLNSFWTTSKNKMLQTNPV
ncbi:MAG: hypothetical protein IPL13_17445 [Saprospiraceae bacterium]|nr:hypothetical protein [Candidatus Brachybacter algidus]